MQASDYEVRSQLDWSREGFFDFCPNTKAFDYRNAYWLAAMSYYSYLNPTYLEQIFSTPYRQRLTLQLRNENGNPTEKRRLFGLGWKGHFDFFSNATGPHPKKFDILSLGKDVTPDVQAFWIDSPELIVVSFRGTEEDNPIDWITDFTASLQLDELSLPFWRRNVHKGFEKSVTILTPWLEKRISDLYRRYPDASSIPVFLTGHSMGGALAVMVMTNWLERNQKVPPRLRLNLKAVYTFGAPRIGSLDYARYFLNLTVKEPVGLYRIVNRRDIVTKAPCIQYNHFGTHVQLLSDLQGNFPAQNVSILINPRSEEFNHCGWGTQITDNLNNIDQYTKDHALESYYSVLLTARRELTRALAYQGRFERSQGLTPNPVEHSSGISASCQPRRIFAPSAPAYLQHNFRFLPFELEY